jgi:hypothetical protein
MSSRHVARTPELKVVLDSSAIFTGSASDLLRTEMVETIKSHSAFPDLAVTWHLPEIVVQERQYQMLRRALELLPGIEKLERILGHQLGITAQILEHRVEETIKAQIGKFGLSVCPLDLARVDWASLVQAAVSRRPPFDPNEKEKGFRDAIVIETFVQLVANSPVTPKVCRLVMVSGDKLLADTVRTRTAATTNVRVLDTLEELTGLINTLVANVDEEFVQQLVLKAERYFFVPKDDSTLYYTQKISTKLSEQFGTELSAVPSGASRRSNTRWLIAAPRFVRKEARRVFWATRITVEATAFARVPAPRFEHPPSTDAEIPGSAGLLAAASSYLSDSARAKMLRSITEPPPASPPAEAGHSLSVLMNSYANLFGQEREVAKGRTALEVDWSATVTTARSLSAPRIEELRHVETVWD